MPEPSTAEVPPVAETLPNSETAVTANQSKWSRRERTMAAILAVILLIALILALLFGISLYNRNNQAGSNANQSNTGQTNADNSEIEEDTSADDTDEETSNNQTTTCNDLTFAFDPGIWQLGVSGITNFVEGTSDQTEAEAVAELQASAQICEEDRIGYLLWPIGTEQPCWACDGFPDEQSISIRTSFYDWEETSDPQDSVETTTEGVPDGYSYAYGTDVVTNEEFTNDNGVEGRIILKKEYGPIASGWTYEFVFLGEQPYVSSTGVFASQEELDSVAVQAELETRKAAWLEVVNTIELD